MAATVFAGVYGFAATLGASTRGLGAGSSMVEACGSGMTVSYPAVFDTGIAGYAVDGVDVSNIPPGCRGKSLSVSFLRADNAPIGSPVRGTLPATGTTASIAVDPTANPIEPGEITKVSVVVS